jgi:hypothetical protein
MQVWGFHVNSACVRRIRQPGGGVMSIDIDGMSEAELLD